MAGIGDAKDATYRALVRAGGFSPLPGAAEWVRRLAAERWRQAVASSAPRENIDVVLEAIGLAGCIEAIVSAEDVRLGVEPRRSIVVEGAAAGVEAARTWTRPLCPLSRRTPSLARSPMGRAAALCYRESSPCERVAQW